MDLERLRLAGELMTKEINMPNSYNFAYDVFDTKYSDDLVKKLAHWAINQDDLTLQEIKKLLIQSITCNYRSRIDEILLDDEQEEAA